LSKGRVVSCCQYHEDVLYGQYLIPLINYVLHGYRRSMVVIRVGTFAVVCQFLFILITYNKLMVVQFSV